MKQIEYALIIDCIHYGAPAIAPNLIKALNEELEKSGAFKQGDPAAQYVEPKEQKEQKETK